MLTSRVTGCLFCGNDQGVFRSVEHVIPANLGNSLRSGLVEEELTVPKGEVCDKCNGDRLSPADQGAARWPPIAAMAALAQMRSRRKRLPESVEGVLWTPQFSEDRRSGVLRLKACTDASTSRDLVFRLLCKLALELRWLEHPVDARSARWDAVARTAIGKQAPATEASVGFSWRSQDGELDLRPDAELRMSDEAEMRFACRMDVLGVDLILLWGGPPILARDWTWWMVDPESGTLCGPDSVKHAFGFTAEAAYRLDPSRIGEPAADGERTVLRGEGEQTMVLRPSKPRSDSSGTREPPSTGARSSR